MNKLVVNYQKKQCKINRNIYGHFSEHLGRCIYGGIFVGEDSSIPNTHGIRNDIVEALKNIKVPVLRWPGGCFADEYHWKDGIGPKETRKRMVNTHWGGVVEDNSFGTHEFLEFCELVGCEPYINGNLGSGTVQEMSEWVEYMTFDGTSPMAQMRKENGREEPWKVKYFGVGNENWGCGGHMRPEYYADLYRRFQTYLRSYGDNKIFKIACGANVDDYNWTEKVMESAGHLMDALTLHYYTIPHPTEGETDWFKKGSSLDFQTDDYYRTIHEALRMNQLVENHSRIMDKYDPDKKVGLIVDEWGTWFDVEPGTNPGFLYQQNTMRDAIVAAISLDIFNKHSDRVIMANIAQMVNVLQAVILTEDEKMLLTPTYHVFDLYKAHQDASLVESYIEAPIIGTDVRPVPAMSTSASVKDGVYNVTISNISADADYPLSFELPAEKAKISARILHGEIHDHNDFDNMEKVKIQNFDSFSIENGVMKFTLPSCSVMHIEIA